MDDQGIIGLFTPLYSDLLPERSFEAQRPLLAHYTTIPTLEKILVNEEVWFSNPLFMNDFEEVRFGIIQGQQMITDSADVVSACKTTARAAILLNAFRYYSDRFDREHVGDTYVFCLSKHRPEDDDGVLSMWRGYGGNGSGVAIVFDTAGANITPGSPMILAEVHYGSRSDRMTWLAKLLKQFADIISTSNIPDDKLSLAAYSLFERLKLFALFSKHIGFKEEDEWRIVYLPDRDTEQKCASMFHYHIGPKGLEPKLRFKVAPIPGLTADDLSLSKIINRIIVGPTHGGIPLLAHSLQRMMERAGKPELVPKLRASSIPFRGSW